jgi:2-dehydro-3-deoxygluconokinase
MIGGTVVCIGECMVEMSPDGPGRFRQGFAGDTFNSAWYLRQVLPRQWNVGYATCVGTDAMSDAMVTCMADAGIDTAAIRRLPDRTVGLYMIHLRDGERSFSYWRGESAARQLAADSKALSHAVRGCDLVLVSGITLAILPEHDRAALIDILGNARSNGSLIAFDPNLRPRLWPDDATMRQAIMQAAKVADIVMPSFDEEALHFGDSCRQATIARYRHAGARSVVVKNGADMMTAWDASEGETEFRPRQVTPRDTTAAGDSFNAGFLAARLQGRGLLEALTAGAALAGQVVQSFGALVPVAES